jgi:hypothetical protein
MFKTQLLFIYIVYILAFISAVLMLFLSVVMMLPISTISIQSTQRSLGFVLPFAFNALDLAMDLFVMCMLFYGIVYLFKAALILFAKLMNSYNNIRPGFLELNRDKVNEQF